MNNLGKNVWRLNKILQFRCFTIMKDGGWVFERIKIKFCDDNLFLNFFVDDVVKLQISGDKLTKMSDDELKTIISDLIKENIN